MLPKSIPVNFRRRRGTHVLALALTPPPPPPPPLLFAQSGSGKTTLMRGLAGATGAGSIVDGDVKVDGKKGDHALMQRLATFIEQTVCVSH